MKIEKKGLKFTALSTCFENNNACIELAKLKKITPQNRHIAAMYHWFRAYIKGSRNKSLEFLDVVKVDTDLQKVDCMTKNLQVDKFLRARKLLCGW